MATITLKQAKIITPHQLGSLSLPIPQSWLDVAGILKGKKKVNPLEYQKQIRKGWETRLSKLERLAKK